MTAGSGAGRGPGLAERATDLDELMDDPSCDPRRLDATLRRFAIVNRLVSGWGAVYRRQLRPLLAGLGRPARVLDLGSGGGDVVARLAGLARRDGLDVEWDGADPDPRAVAAAHRYAGDGIRFFVASGADLRASGDVYDAVLSNHVLHHLSASELAAFADDSLALSRGPVLHGDIARGRLAYGLYAMGITPLAPGTFLRTDGLRSIRRSYRPSELGAALGPAWSVVRPAPFRLLAVGRGRATDAADAAGPESRSSESRGSRARETAIGLRGNGLRGYGTRGNGMRGSERGGSEKGGSERGGSENRGSEMGGSENRGPGPRGSEKRGTEKSESEPRGPERGGPERGGGRA